MDRREKSGVKPEQLRCCNWIRFPTSQSIATAIGEGGKKEGSKGSDRKPGARIFEPVRLIRQRGAEPRFNFLGSRSL